MSEEKPSAEETPADAPPPTGLGVLFLAAALALLLVLSFVALIAYAAFSPGATANPPPRTAPVKPAPEGNMYRAAPGIDRCT